MSVKLKSNLYKFGMFLGCTLMFVGGIVAKF